MEPEIDRDAVRQFPWAAGLSDEELRQAAASLQRVSLLPGQALFRAGDPGDAAYLIARGEVEVLLPRQGQEDRRLVIGEGTVLGELGLLLDRPRSASAVAVQPTEAWRVERRAFEQALERKEGWAVKAVLELAKTVAGRFASLDEELAATLGRMQAEGEASRPVADLERLREHLISGWGF